jgi:glyoxylase-like metal-dependent hydrolase (beta-lactamase superfamily II)
MNRKPRRLAGFPIHEKHDIIAYKQDNRGVAVHRIKKSIKFMITLTLIMAAGTAAFYLSPMLMMRPVETGIIPGTNITAVQNNRNAVFFVDTGNGYIMIDAGSNAESIEIVISALRIPAGDVKWIFLTHSDSDHVEALPLFPNAAVYINAAELPLLNGTVKRNAFSENSLPGGISESGLNRLVDGEAFSLGNTEIECINTPGHTIGSMSYLVDGKYLFTGDAFMVYFDNIGVHPFTMDRELAERSIGELEEIVNASELVLTGHYGYFEGGLFNDAAGSDITRNSISRS